MAEAERLRVELLAEGLKQGSCPNSILQGSSVRGILKDKFGQAKNKNKKLLKVQGHGKGGGNRI